MSAKAGGERPRSQSGLASVPSLNEIREGLADVAAGIRRPRRARRREGFQRVQQRPLRSELRLFCRLARTPARVGTERPPRRAQGRDHVSLVGSGHSDRVARQFASGVAPFRRRPGPPQQQRDALSVTVLQSQTNLADAWPIPRRQGEIPQRHSWSSSMAGKSSPQRRTPRQCRPNRSSARPTH